MSRIIIEKQATKQATINDLRPGLELWRMGYDRRAYALNPHHPMVFAGTVVSVGDVIVMELETGKHVAMTYRGQITPFYVVREVAAVELPLPVEMLEAV